MARRSQCSGRGAGGKPGCRYELTDEAWQRIEPLLPTQGRGGRWNDHRVTLNGMFWILNSGAQWRDLPERYGKWQSVYDRYRRWTGEGLFDRILQRLHLSLDEDGRIDWSVFDVDGSNIRADRSAAGARKKGLPRTRRPCPGTIPRRLWHEASSGDRRSGGAAGRVGDRRPVPRVQELRGVDGHGEDQPPPGHPIRETRSTLPGYGQASNDPTMLTPARSVRQDRVGQGHEWELPDGRNIGPTAETYALPLDSPRVRQSRELGEGLRGWRVEIQDAKEGRQARFLNVMQTADKTTAAMSPCKMVQKDSMVGASVEDGGKTIEVYFNQTGAVGGKIIITQGGKKLVERPLTTKIEDNYERWSATPDYAKWISDPLRQNVVLNRRNVVLNK